MLASARSQRRSSARQEPLREIPVRVSDAPSPAEKLAAIATEPEIGGAWLWRLRWAALAGLGPMLLSAHYALELPLHAPALAAAAVISAVSNVALARRLRRVGASDRSMLLVLLLDVVWLTYVLHAAGGAANPFSALFVVHVAVASLLLGPWSALAMTALTALCFASLLFVSDTHAGGHLHDAFPQHLRGMWIAYVLSASFVAYFVSRIAGALRSRERAMASLRRYAAGMERVASLSTMATGAAHELGGPLSSIAVAATDLAEALSDEPRWAAFAQEARGIREEVARCRSILDRLARGAGQLAGEAPETLALSTLVERLKRELGPVNSALLEVSCGAAAIELRSPPIALTQSLTSLVRNGIDAGRTNGNDGRVTLQVSSAAGCATFEIVDRGAGFPNGIAERIGEPFLSTKPAGTGMGLGLFLVNAFAQQVGGQLAFERGVAGGMVARLQLGHGSSLAVQEV